MVAVGRSRGGHAEGPQWSWEDESAIGTWRVKGWRLVVCWLEAVGSMKKVVVLV